MSSEIIQKFQNLETQSTFQLPKNTLPTEILESSLLYKKPENDLKKLTDPAVRKSNPVRSCPKSSGYGKLTTQRLLGVWFGGYWK